MHLFVVANFVLACCWKVPRLPILGETLGATDLSIEPGGKGLNVAVGAKRLGNQVTALFGIGHDQAGDRLLALLQQESLSCELVYRLDSPSGHGAGLINAEGGNAIAVYPGANLLLTAEHAALAEADISRSAWVYGQFETSIAVVQSCFQLAKQHNVLTALNPSPWQAISKELLTLTDVLLVNEIEVQALLNLQFPLSNELAECAAQLASACSRLWPQWRGQLLVVTLGALGAVALKPTQPAVTAPGFNIQALDTVGAGDAFAAGLLHKLGANAELTEALMFANACGALVASQVGVLEALPSIERVERFLAENHGCFQT
jgi:ribokinase